MTMRTPTDSFPVSLAVVSGLLILSVSLFTQEVSSLVRLNKTLTLATDGHNLPLVYQSRLTGFNITTYIRNPRIIKFQAHCFFYGGPCDLVGKWAKPRIITGILGKCEKCTKEQDNWIEIVFGTIAERYPIMFRALLAKFLEYMEVKVPAKERRLIARMFE